MKEGKNVETVSIRVAGQDAPAIINKSDFNEKTQELYTERPQKAAPANAEPVKTDPVKPATDKPATVAVLC